jgi:hypothetical protein
VEQQAVCGMTVRRIFWLWLPLSVSFTLMMLEGPSIQAAIARLDDSQRNLAAFGLVFALSLVIESPVIMLISTAIALARDGQAYRTLRSFVYGLMIALTALTALVAWTPLYALLVDQVLGIPSTISAVAQPALRIMLLWSAAIGVRRFYQGLLVLHGLTTRVTYGTAIRLLITFTVAMGLARWGRLPGAQLGACALMAGVVSEALATYLFAWRLVRRVYITDHTTPAAPLTLGAITRFHTPLAATSLLTLLVQPLTAAALARMPSPQLTLAAWPVVFGTLLVLRGWGMALQETTVAQANLPDAQMPLRRFALIVALTTSLGALLLAWTPLLDAYVGNVLGVQPALWPVVRGGLQLAIVLPAFTALVSWQRGSLVAAKHPSSVYGGMGLNLAIYAAVLLVGVAQQWPGVPTAAGALVLAIVIEYGFLHVRSARLAQTLGVTPDKHAAAVT